MGYEIIFRSKLTVATSTAYALTLEAARALVMHHLTAGRYDSGNVYGPDGRSCFRATRWYSPHFAAVVDRPEMSPRREVPAGMNPYEFAARVGKAAKLADALHKYGITKADALLMDEAMWKLAAAGAGVNPPSSVTQMLAIETLARLEAAEVAA